MSEFLSDAEFADMMQEFESAGEWMDEQIKSRRVALSTGAVEHAATDSVWQVEVERCQTTGDRHSRRGMLR